MLNYFSIGAMGLGSSHGLGLALGRPNKRVLVLDGDGSLLMNLGSLVTIAAAAPTCAIAASRPPPDDARPPAAEATWSITLILCHSLLPSATELDFERSTLNFSWSRTTFSVPFGFGPSFRDDGSSSRH